MLNRILDFLFICKETFLGRACCFCGYVETHGNILVNGKYICDEHYIDGSYLDILQEIY